MRKLAPARQSIRRMLRRNGAAASRDRAGHHGKHAQEADQQENKCGSRRPVCVIMAWMSDCCDRQGRGRRYYRKALHEVVSWQEMAQPATL